MKPMVCIDLKNLNISGLKPAGIACDECVKIDESWVHLRTCQTCGITLCCDNSINKHMTAHFKETGHPLVISAEEKERWAWCYEHQLLANY
jgi:hypothetical protein